MFPLLFGNLLARFFKPFFPCPWAFQGRGFSRGFFLKVGQKNGLKSGMSVSSFLGDPGFGVKLFWGVSPGTPRIGFAYPDINGEENTPFRGGVFNIKKNISGADFN